MDAVNLLTEQFSKINRTEIENGGQNGGVTKK